MFSYVARFWLYLIILIPSVICALYFLYHLVNIPAHRRALNNHTVILLVFLGLLYQLTDIVWFIHYYHAGTVLISEPAFCLAWGLIDTSGYVTISILVAWTSVERHILIFHQNWVSTATKRVLIHYLPLVILSLYPSIFYAFVYFVLPCEEVFDYNEAVCDYYPCLDDNLFVRTWDSIVHFIMPTFIIVIFSVALLVRVWYQKRRLHRRMQWRKYRKMAVQLLSISAIYFLFLLPWTVLYTAYAAGLPDTVAADYYSTISYLSYLVVMLTPFVSVMSLPELRRKLRDSLFFRCKRARRVRPETLTMARLNPVRAATVVPSAQ